ncbi:hypothetical protein BDY19DRAFT_433237 [Irpex rosettiformis]|uniref:Uncharacterized protein n=1 Tax=Irpex rosettiformis TaxID=378272 RepID=A0ACB8TUE2_9APHY|nr:hypothetical protein BDY19DRAFT_433237 [Irpex rosettiformis]
MLCSMGSTIVRIKRTWSRFASISPSALFTSKEHGTQHIAISMGPELVWNSTTGHLRSEDMSSRGISLCLSFPFPLASLSPCHGRSFSLCGRPIVMLCDAASRIVRKSTTRPREPLTSTPCTIFYSQSRGRSGNRAIELTLISITCAPTCMIA